MPTSSFDYDAVYFCNSSTGINRSKMDGVKMWAGAVEMSFQKLDCSDEDVRMISDWVAGFHPQHVFLDAALETSQILKVFLECQNIWPGVRLFKAIYTGRYEDQFVEFVELVPYLVGVRKDGHTCGQYGSLSNDLST